MSTKNTTVTGVDSAREGRHLFNDTGKHKRPGADAWNERRSTDSQRTDSLHRRRLGEKELSAVTIFSEDVESAGSQRNAETSSNRSEKEAHSEDYMSEAVPSSRRYSTVTMTLLWITMLTNFPMVIFGFEFYRTGFSLSQVLIGCLTGCAILVAFQFFSGYMGARTGLNYSLLMKPLFGRYGVKLVCALWALMFLGWYAMNAILMTESMKGLFNLSFWTPLLAVPILAVMAINNWFGFRGVANFARFIAAPVLILWVGYAFTKTVNASTLSLVFAPSTQAFSYSLVVIPVLVIGNTTWGNEADFFRYGKSSKLLTLVPLLVSVMFGALLFPTTGWLLGHASGATDTASFTRFMNDYSFGHAPWLAALALTIGYFAVNDGNLYGAINAFENIWTTKRHNAVLFLVVLSAALAIALSYCPNALDTVAALNSVILPCATMIIICEFIVSRKCLAQMPMLQTFQETAGGDFGVNNSSRRMCIVATTALIISWVVGIAASGMFAQLKFLNVGVWILYAWGASFLIYGAARWLQLYRALNAYKRAEAAYVGVNESTPGTHVASHL